MAGAAAQKLGDLEAVDVGQLDVEQDDVRMQGAGGLEGGLAVHRLADHLVAVGLQQRPGAGPEAGVVVDDEDARCHASRLPSPYPGFEWATLRGVRGEPHLGFRTGAGDPRGSSRNGPGG